MNKFLIHEGGQPIWLEDINFMQESVRESVVQIVAGMTGIEKPTCILYGCDDVKGKDRGTTAGVVCINGEVFPAEASELNLDTAHMHIVKETAGRRKTQDGRQIEAYESSKVIMTEQEEGLPLRQIPRLAAMMHIVRSSDEYTVFDVWTLGEGILVRGDLLEGTIQGPSQIGESLVIDIEHSLLSSQRDNFTYFPAILDETVVVGYADKKDNRLRIFINAAWLTGQNRRLTFNFIA